MNHRKLFVSVSLLALLVVSMLFAQSLQAQETPDISPDALTSDVPLRSGAANDPGDAPSVEQDFDAWLAETSRGEPVPANLPIDPWVMPDDFIENEPDFNDPAFLGEEWYLQQSDGFPATETADSEVMGADAESPDIVGGTNAGVGEFPWQAALMVDGRFNCGGSLILPRWVLTAAHCVTEAYSNGTWDSLAPSKITIILGDHVRSVNEGTEVSRSVAQVSVYPYYNSRLVTNDLALVKLTTPVALNARIQTIPIATLAEQNSIAAPGRAVTVSGWGRLATGASLADTLQKLTSPVITQATCADRFIGIAPISADMLCVGMGGAGSCNGDSGGPLVAPLSGGWRQVGVVSWGSSVCEMRPSVYARAAYFREWILSVLATTWQPTPANPGFESGSNGQWIEASTPSYEIVTNQSQITPHGGSWLAWMGGEQNLTQFIWQNLNLADRPSMLRFWYLVRSSETNCEADSGRVYVQGQIVLTIPLCASNAQSGWREAVVELGSSGQTVWYGFWVANNGANVSSLYVDDISIQTNAPAPLALTTFAPATARDGATVTITGNGFLDATRVTFAGVPASYQVVSNTQIRALVPAAARSGKVVVSTISGNVQSVGNFSKIHTLKVRILGLGSGAVARQGDGAICNGCVIEMSDGDTVTLTASPAGGSTFLNWTAPCAGKPASCTFTATGSTEITVVFGIPGARHMYLPTIDR